MADESLVFVYVHHRCVAISTRHATIGFQGSSIEANGDGLGRNAMDVQSVVKELAACGVRVHCQALGGVDLTSRAGKMTMGGDRCRCRV